MNTPLTREQVINLPNTLLLDPATGQAAAFDGVHRLITGDASQALMAYAKVKGYKESKWDESQHKPGGRWYQMPDWASKEVRERSTLYWVRSGKETEEELRAIPQA